MTLDVTPPREETARGAIRRPNPGRTVPWGSGPQHLDVLVLVLLVLVGLWRWSLVSGIPGPIGVDGGNWLRLFRAALGDVDVDDVLTPPLVPLLAGATGALVGPLGAARALPVIASLAPSVGAWWVLRRRAHGPVAVVATVALALVSPTAAATAWGGVPQLIGLGLLPPFLLALVTAVDARTSRAWRRAASMLALIAVTSTLITALALVASIAIVLDGLVRGRTVPMRSALAALAPLMPVGVLYAVILTRMSLPAGRATAATGLPALRAGLGEPVVVWMVLLGVVLIAMVVRSEGAARSIDLGMVVAGLSGLLLGDVRFTAAIPTAIVMGVGLLPRPLRHVQRIAAAALLVLAWSGVTNQATQLRFYSQLVPPTIVEDATAIADFVSPEDVVAVPPVAGAPTGWWLEARGIDAAVASRPDWLSFPEERTVAQRTVALFSAPRWPTPGTASSACAQGSRFLYVPEVWGGMDPEALADEVRAGRLEALGLPGGVLLRSLAC